MPCVTPFKKQVVYSGFVRLAVVCNLFFIVNNNKMVATIDLKAFLDWYKTATIELGDKKRVFREPVLKDLDLQVIELLEKYCIEWDFNELQAIIETEMPFTKRKELYDNILQELGLVL